MSLYERVRAGSEAAPWVVEEIRALEDEKERMSQEIEKFNNYVGPNIMRGDFKTVNEMRKALDECKAELAHIRAALDKLKEEMRGDAEEIKEYRTPLSF